MFRVCLLLLLRLMAGVCSQSCTVKSPSQAGMSRLLQQGRAQGKRLLVAGCVPQGQRKLPELQEFSLLGACLLILFALNVQSVRQTAAARTLKASWGDSPAMGTVLTVSVWCGNSQASGSANMLTCS